MFVSFVDEEAAAVSSTVLASSALLVVAFGSERQNNEFEFKPEGLRFKFDAST